MKRIILLMILLAVLNIWGLDPIYHNNAEIAAELDSLQQQYPDIMMVRELGVTATDGLPVLAVKISDNVTVDEDEPAVLFLGQCHAEEVMGVEICMAMIHEMLLYHNTTYYTTLINNIEIWIVPTHNPEGLQVVTDEWDTSYRKNKSDTNNNGIFDFVVGVGHDVDGVDLNRNYDFNWVHSDTLYTPGGNELYDYYRGPSPFSEPEAQYVKQLADEQHFILSIAWHSSRTGNLSEKVYYPWNWEQQKPCVDLEFNAAYAATIAYMIENQTGSGYYQPFPTEGRNSKAHDWFYNEYGTLQFEIEAGTSNLQPGPEILLDTIERCKVAPYHMMNRVLGYQSDDKALLKGIITDAVTGEPLQAEYIIEERNAPSFTPRFSDELYGRYWWICAARSYTLHVRKKGYADNVQSVYVSNMVQTVRDVALQPLADATLSGSVSFSGTPTPLSIIVLHEMGDEIFGVAVDEQNYEIDWWEGTAEFVLSAEGYTTKFVSIDLAAGENNYNIVMEPEVVLFSEDWSGDFSQWVVDGDWYIGADPIYGVPAAKDTPNRFYQNSSESTLEIEGFFNLHGASELSLKVMNNYHTEHGYDFCYIEIKPDGSDIWQQVKTLSGVRSWKYDYIDLSDYVDTYSRIRFRLSTDDSLDDPGWWIGEMKLVSATAVDQQESELPAVTALGVSYPNPFYANNSRIGTCKIDYSISQAGEVELSVYNLRGQKVRSLVSETVPAGKYTISWDGRNNAGQTTASGVYFYQLKTDSEIINRKMILIR
ncbi:MAG: T9SS type A sorting domain-containing protein [Candidatus Cloacimonetes bacterium]|nr:T9SS type A sorting domain-containing protein [Candidatus Cloacimonadota bacterium]